MEATFENPIGDGVSRLRFAPKSNNLLISSWDNSLRLYDVGSSRLRLESPCDAALLDCCFQGESVAFSAGTDGGIRRYDLHSGINDIIGNHDDIATCVGYSDGTCLVISAGLDKNIMYWDTRVGKDLVYLRNLDAEVQCMSLSRLNMIVAAGTSVNVYDLRKIEVPVLSSRSCMSVQIRCASIIPDSTGYVVGSLDGRVTLELFNPTARGDEGYTFRCHPKSKNGRLNLVSINDIVFNPCNHGTFTTGDNEGYVITWDAKSKRRKNELPRFSNSISSLSYNHEGELLAVASSCVYQEMHELETSPRIHIHRVDDCTVSPFSAGSSTR